MVYYTYVTLKNKVLESRILTTRYSSEENIVYHISVAFVLDL